jgi:dTDP-glucose pyrophosphorylase
VITIEKNSIKHTATIKQALEQLNALGVHLTLFVVDYENVLLGIVTDGDIRRALINGALVDDEVTRAMNTNFKFVKVGAQSYEQISGYKKDDIKILPVVNEDFTIAELLDLENFKCILPIDAIIMAGGKGERLLPLTAKIPKPMLPINGKPIIEFNIDRLASFGVKNIVISIKYLGHIIEEYFANGSAKNLKITYVTESEPLGTIGAIGNITNVTNDTILVMNSDLLTNIDFEDFYKDFKEKDAAMAVATVAYDVNVPYAVLETNEGKVTSLKEKPTYSYHSNAGIYLIKKEWLKLVPKHTFYNATDLIESLIALNQKVICYNIVGYWLDIGRHDDYTKAQEDVKHLVF